MPWMESALRHRDLSEYTKNTKENRVGIQKTVVRWISWHNNVEYLIQFDMDNQESIF